MIDEKQETIELRRFLWPIARYRYLILTFCVSATLSSLGLTYVMSERYRATVVVLYQPHESVSFRPKQQDALGFPPPIVPLESIANTLEDVVQSDGVIEQTVRILRLDVNEKRPSANKFIAAYQDLKDQIKELRTDVWEILRYGRLLPKDPLRRAMESLRGNISIKRTNKAYSFRLEALDENPQRAAKIVDTMGALLSDFLISEQVQGARQAREKIAPRLEQSEEEIAKKRTALESFKKQTGVSSQGEELSLKLKVISDFERDLTTVHNELRSLESKRAELLSQLQQQERSVKYDSTTTDNPVVDDLKLQLARLEIERSGLVEKFTPKNQEVKAVDAKISAVRDKLTRETPTIISAESTRLNDIYQTILTEKLSTEAEIQTLIAKERTLRQVVSRETGLARALTESEPQLAEMALQLRSAEQSYELINEAYEEARLGESKTASEVTLQDRALVPSEPARPIKILHVGTTFLLGLVLSVGFAFMLDFFDSTLREIEQVERLFEVPVFATIPAVPDAALPRDKKISPGPPKARAQTAG
jgi:uncharacterized protein involved in exopolysaccharide biosynthesis